jgi:hypothetical protein
MQDEAEGKTKEENMSLMKEKIEGLKGKVKELLNAEVGINLSQSDRAYDIVLYSEFESLDTLNEYRYHPEHKEVLDFINSVIEDVKVVDYES